ncbi:hypothetical protein D9M69_280960 [compost metagenome]
MHGAGWLTNVARLTRCPSQESPFHGFASLQALTSPVLRCRRRWRHDRPQRLPVLAGQPLLRQPAAQLRLPAGEGPGAERLDPPQPAGHAADRNHHLPRRPVQPRLRPRLRPPQPDGRPAPDGRRPPGRDGRPRRAGDRPLHARGEPAQERRHPLQECLATPEGVLRGLRPRRQRLPLSLPRQAADGPGRVRLHAGLLEARGLGAGVHPAELRPGGEPAGGNRFPGPGAEGRRRQAGLAHPHLPGRTSTLRGSRKAQGSAARRPNSGAGRTERGGRADRRAGHARRRRLQQLGHRPAEEP